VHPAKFDTDGQIRDQLAEPRVDGAAHVHHVGPGDVADGEPDGGRAVEAHQPSGGSQVIVLDLTDVPDLDQLRGARGAGGAGLGLRVVGSGSTDRQVGDVGGGGEGAGGRDAKPAVLHLQVTAVHHEVLLLQRGLQGAGTDAELGELGLGHVQVDDLRLRAPKIHAGDAVDQAQLAFEILGMLLQLRIAEAVADHRQHVSEHIAEIVAHDGAIHAGRQVAFHVTNLASELVEDLRYLGRHVGRLEVDEDQRLSLPGVRLQVVDLLHLLQLELQAIGDLLLHLQRARPRILGDDHRRLHGEVRIFELPKGEEAGDPGGKHQEGAEIGDRALLDGEGGEAHGASCSSRRTGCPSRR
jgi:hypothetical protein